jgi:PIN domain nuclease of toxin-antitoxin system
MIRLYLKETLKLPSKARAAIAGTSIDSLDETIDQDAESAWETEILSRLKEIDEANAAARWYQERSYTAGKAFVSELDRIIEKIIAVNLKFLLVFNDS